MTQVRYPLRPVNSPNLSGVHQNFRAIDATYYDVTDAEGWPVAGLLVLLDRHGRAVRAELYLYEGVTLQNHEAAMRQAHLLLQNRYTSYHLDDDALELRILKTQQLHNVIQVPLQPSVEPHGPTMRLPQWWPLAATAAAALIFLIVAAVWAVPTFFRGTDGDVATSTQPVAADPQTIDPNSVNGTAAVADVVSDIQTNNLPASRNAHVDLAVGQRVRIRPSLNLTLRSEPGADAGEAVGYMQNSSEATIIGGPHWTQGDSDTIVWWYVRLDDGTEAWAAANTSTLTLLEPVE